MSTTYLAMCDWQQSVLGDGQVGRRYTPYGALPQVAGPRLAYCGMPCEVLTGNYSPGNGHRTYDPELKRFHSPDRLSPFGDGGINAYAYCSGDPINREDRNGRYNNSLFHGKLSQTVGGMMTPWLGVDAAALGQMYRTWRVDGADGRPVPTFKQVLLQSAATVSRGVATGFSAVGLFELTPQSAKPRSEFNKRDKAQQGIFDRGLTWANALALGMDIAAFKANKDYYPGFGSQKVENEGGPQVPLVKVRPVRDGEGLGQPGNAAV
ncbi:RHS repeat-associated core domain-containing protein [Pseudomonas mosselii]|uniref:RHS repeat-associated core domain-containing protein n=1 Tax=unclassified Pseudomonas TaxID=196821 RepID=UPI0020C2212D|nr:MULTISPECIES: RHS repeat-associated core domain-containing protein [unclassified Pseudomonas]MCP8635053.1 RHS repeat-associated core domain-containing protein [Pseudomonas sp. DVZ6]MDD7785515.1 RHS repeat-associated core domain-containing protein [Pseudomonas sp. DVZ24]